MLAGCSRSLAPESSSDQRVEFLKASDRQAVLAGLQTGTFAPRMMVAPGEAEKDVCRDLKSELPANYKSAAIEVPEDWASPDGKKIKVFYYFSEKTASETPIVFFNGGPASDSHSSFQNFRVSKTMKDLPFVFIDQRGTGCSTKFPVNDGDDPHRLKYYGSRAIVADAEAIRKTVFGGRKWRVFGQSYGGLITHRYATVAPEGVSAGFAHGFALMKDPKSWVAGRILSQERVWTEFASANPGADEALRAARKKISSTTCFSNGQARICGSEILDSLVMMLGFRTSWGELKSLIAELSTDDAMTFKLTVRTLAQWYALGVYAAQGLPGDYISRLEIAPAESDSKSCQGAFEVIRAAGRDPEAFTLNECRLLIAIERDNPERVAKAPNVTPDLLSLGDFRKALLANPGLKFHLYSGRLDVFSPIEIYGEELQEVKDLLRYREFSKSGHEGFSSEPDVLRDLLATP
jgi:pimeloyl-ACP methyl ester carboxylesterase